MRYNVAISIAGDVITDTLCGLGSDHVRVHEHLYFWLLCTIFKQRVKKFAHVMFKARGAKQ